MNHIENNWGNVKFEQNKINNESNKKDYVFETTKQNADFLRQNESSRDSMIAIDEKWWNEFEELQYSTKVELVKLQEGLNLIRFQWVSIRKRENVNNYWVLKNVKKLRLDEVLHMWQSLSIVDKNWQKTNVVWWVDKNWNYTYIKEWTKDRIVIFDWMKIWAYDNNIIKTSFERHDNKTNENWNEWFKLKPKILSAPTYKNPKTWVTQCSRTARENLAKLWAKKITRWGSAKDSFEEHGWTPEKFPPNDESATLVDLYLDASPKNRKYWHRAVWVKIEWNWHVLDPYYNWTREPVPAEKYLAKMQWQKGRKIWWGYVVA